MKLSYLKVIFPKVVVETKKQQQTPKLFPTLPLQQDL